MSQSQVVPCPHCGANYQLSTEYISQYGGQQTQCAQCKQPMPIPTTLTAPDAEAAPPQPVAVLPYMGPPVGQMTPTSGIWRDGKLLVISKGYVLPARCVKCNEPAHGTPMYKTLYWHEPWVYILILPGLLIYAIVAMAVRKTGSVGISLCRKHRVRRRWIIFGALMAIPLAIVSFFIAAIYDLPEVFVPLGIILIIGGIVAGILGSRTVWPSRIDNYYMYLKGASPEFLHMLPDARPPAAFPMIFPTA